jgi:tetratricopeptide (TPR) repeat protein
MNTATFTTILHVRLRWALPCVLVLLLGCASAPATDIATQRFDAAFRTGSERFAAGDLQQAAAAFEQAERMAALYDRRALRIQALFSLGAVAAVREQDQAALQAYGQAQVEAHGLGDVHSEAVARAGLAEQQRRAGDNGVALQGFELALAADALRPESVERLQARMGRALVWNATGMAPAARDELQLLEAQARASSSALLPAVLANQAVVLRDSGDVPAAIAKAQEALELDRRLSSPFALAADLEMLGTLYRARGNNAEAQASFARALRIVQSTGQARSVKRLQQLQQLVQ